MNDLICIAKITKPHGVKGQAKLVSYCQNPKDIFSFHETFDKEGNVVKVKFEGQKDNSFIVSFIPNITRNEVEQIVNTEIYIDKSSLPLTNDNEFYNIELEGMKIFDTTNKLFGEIVKIHNFGAGDIIEIKEDNKKETCYLPFDQHYIVEINSKERKIIFDLSEF